ncbi:putative protein kinase CAMK-CDPK family [Helianthus anomalus]
MSQTGKLMPNLDQNSTKILNLTILQRMDLYIEEMSITAAHVTFYEFNVNLSQWLDPWTLISDSVKDLIRKMLCSRPSDRLTAHEVRCHPWICENGVAPDRALDPAVLSRLKQFSANEQVKENGFAGYNRKPV